MTRLFTALCPNLTKYVMLLQYTLHIATTINVTHATRADFDLYVSCDNLHSKLYRSTGCTLLCVKGFELQLHPTSHMLHLAPSYI